MDLTYDAETNAVDVERQIYRAQLYGNAKVLQKMTPV